MISQSVSGQRMADILALDADGCLVIVEIKRDWSNRATVGQLLEYAAAMTGKNYEDLIWKNWTGYYWPRRNGESRHDPYVSLLERFRTLTDDPEADQKDIPKRQSEGHRIYIVAPGSDKGLLRIVEWLKEYGVPISFVPFTLHAGAARSRLSIYRDAASDGLKAELKIYGQSGPATWREAMDEDSSTSR